MASYYSTSDSVWSTWTTSSTYTTTSTASTWTAWVDATDSTTTTSTTEGMVWVRWVYSSSPSEHSRDAYVYGKYSAPKESEEEKAARLERERQERESAAERERQRVAAEKERERKARQLLREVLSHEQNEAFDKTGAFELRVVGGSRYRIKNGTAYNVEKLDERGQVVQKLCFGLGYEFHKYDSIAAQKLMLECNEKEALCVANKQAVAAG